LRKTLFLAALSALLCLGHAAAAQRHYSVWTYADVNVPKYANTVLTGINNLGKIVGYAYTDSINGAVVAVTAQPPYTSWWSISFPGATHSVVSGLSNTYIQVGHYQSVGGTFAYIHDHGVFASYEIPGTEFRGENNILCGGHNCGPGQQNSHTDPLIVGYIEISPGIYQAFEYDYATKGLALLNPPGAVSAIATGVNGKNHIVGSMVTANGTAESWLLLNGKYYEFAYPGAVRTTALGLNWQDNIVGAYVDASGKTHGFIYSYPDSAHRAWQTIDEPNAVDFTVIYSINDHDAFVGDYADAAGRYHGFLATPQS
jgi:hypothetical protein